MIQLNDVYEGTCPYAGDDIDYIRDDPFVASEFDNRPEMLGSWLSDAVKEVADALKGTKVEGVTVQTNNGTATIGPGGINYTDGTLPTVPITPYNPMTDMLKNPLVIGGAILAIYLLTRKGR